MQVRHEKRASIISSGSQAYPVTVPVTTTIPAIRHKYPDLNPDDHTGEVVGVAGEVQHHIVW